MDLSGKVCVITGGIFRYRKISFNKICLQRSICCASCRRNSKLTSIIDEIKQSCRDAIQDKNRYHKSIECKNLIDEILDQYGRIDLLLLGAGVSMWTPFDKIFDISFFKDVMDTNYTDSPLCSCCSSIFNFLAWYGCNLLNSSGYSWVHELLRLCCFKRCATWFFGYFGYGTRW